MCTCIFHWIPDPNVFGQHLPDPERILPHRIRIAMRALSLQMNCMKKLNFIHFHIAVLSVKSKMFYCKVPRNSKKVIPLFKSY